MSCSVRPAARVLLAAAAIVFLFTACDSDDPAAPTPPDPANPSGEPPSLPATLSLPIPDFVSADTTARRARLLVLAHENQAAILARIGESFMLSLNGADWSDWDGGCCEQIVPDPSCRRTWRVCAAPDDRLEWIEILDGVCGYGEVFHNAVSYRGVSSRDGSSGAFQKYRANTNLVDRSWSWIISAGGAEVERSYYDGAPVPLHLLGTLQQVKRADQSQHVSFETPSGTRWEMEVSRNLRTGRMTTQAWRPATGWQKTEEVSWENGHGGWQSFDTLGQESSHRLW